MTRPTTIECRALEALEASLADQRHVAMLSRLVAIPSVTGTAAESEAQHWVARQCVELGLDVDMWRIDLEKLRTVEGFPGMEVKRDEGWGVVALTSGSSDQPGLALQGHIDVVPPGERRLWFGRDPFHARVEGDIVHGRGTCDMKAGVVANLLAVEAVTRSGVPLKRPLALHSVVSEEDGGLGAFATLHRGHRADACIISEPTSRTVVTANAGALTFTLTVLGRATHGSTRYAGVSAIEVFERVHACLRALEERRNRDVDPLMAEYPIAYPILVGRLHAGDWSSTVPDRLIAEGRYGVRLGETVDEARDAFEEALTELAVRDPWLTDYPVQVDWTGGQYAAGRITSGHPLVGVTRDAWACVTNRRKPRERGAPYGSDQRLYNDCGVATLHLGPGEVRHAHALDEQVSLTELADVARALVLVALRTCAKS